MPDLPEPIVQATRYEVSLLPEDNINRRHFTITVEWRGDDRWAVCRFHECLGKDGAWEYEPRPSERDDDWVEAHRFGLDSALALAKQAAPDLVVNGHTAADAWRRTHRPA
ncbi:hypothetical protein DT019_03180 [Streptomyces sp. SDr-06]|uniref:hypothetical protein n=1 Tax=Streptomyces sp. SDr-06 TaxID=2267702 RepID=UPI000DEA8E92|nr:hypothetical protein [Streptomyces sp. SDr-06]RCH70507.1 hypothetical protein DT019_03180 [Streptomyces sp. SDr-06]